MWERIIDALKDSWPAIGPLVGIVLGAVLTRSRERKKWFNDSRREEFRELLTTLTTATMALVMHHDPSHAASLYTRPEKQWDAQDAYNASLQVLQDRIFIADDLKKLDAFNRWTKGRKDLVSTGNYEQFESEFERLIKGRYSGRGKTASLRLAGRWATRLLHSGQWT